MQDSPLPEEPKVVGELSAPPPRLTREEYGKLRRRYITVVQGTVTKCGHKFHATNDPRTNCNDCWEAFFRVHEGIVSGVQSILSAFSEEQLVSARGVKFVKQYKRFAAMVEAEQQNVSATA